MDERLVEFESNFSVLDRYGVDVTANEFITNPAIGRDQQIKELMLILLTPEKSAILIGKPGIGKTAIVEGLAYRMQRGEVPEALQGYTIINIKTASLLGTMPSGESKVQKMIDELKTRDKVILFVDEIHMLIGATDSSSLDFANIFKEGLGRGSIKVIGATTSDEYERYILRDKAFTRRFQKVEVPEPSREETIQIMMGTLPKFEKQTGRKMKYTPFIQERIMSFLVDITSEYKRVFALGSRYPDVCLTLLKQAFSYTVFDNREYMDIFDVRKAIESSKNIYPDVIRKELPRFDTEFNDILLEEKGMKPVEEWRRDNTPIRYAQNPASNIISDTQGSSDNGSVNGSFFKNLESTPDFVDKKQLSDMKPVKGILGKNNANKFATIGSASVSKGFNEKFNQKKDSKNLDNLLLSSEIGVLSKEDATNPNIPIKYSVTNELKPGGTNDLLLGSPIASTLDKKDTYYEVEKYKSDNLVVKELDANKNSLMLDGYIDRPNNNLVNNNSNVSIFNRIDNGNNKSSVIDNNNGLNKFDPFGLNAPKKIVEEEKSGSVYNNSNDFDSFNNKKSSSDKFDSIFNKKSDNKISGGLSTKDESLFGAPMYDNSSTSEEVEEDTSNGSVDIFGQLLSDNMRISNGKIVEDLPGFSSSFNSKPVIGEVVSAGDGRFENNRDDYGYNGRQSSGNTFGLNSFLNDAIASNDSNNDNESSGFNSSKFLSGINNNELNNKKSYDDNTNAYENSSNNFINFNDLNAGKIPQNEVNKFISFSDNNRENRNNRNDYYNDRPYRDDDRRYDNRGNDRPRSNVFSDNVLDMVNNSRRMGDSNSDNRGYDRYSDRSRPRDDRYFDNDYDMRRGIDPRDGYSGYDRYPERNRPRVDRYFDSDYDMRRGPDPRDGYSRYDRYPYPERNRPMDDRYPQSERDFPMDDRYPDNRYDSGRNLTFRDEYANYDRYPERNRPMDDRYSDNGYVPRRESYDNNSDINQNKQDNVGSENVNLNQATNVSDVVEKREVSLPPVDLNLENNGSKDIYFDDFFED